MMNNQNLIKQIKNIDCSNTNKYVSWLMSEYKKEPFNIEKIKEYLLKYHVLNGEKNYDKNISFNNVSELINKVNNTIESNYDIILDNDDIIIYKPNSYINRNKIRNKLYGYIRRVINICTDNLYCCIIKNNDVQKNIGLDYFICHVKNDVHKYYQEEEILINESVLINLDIKKYLVADDINERIKNETIQNIKLLEQEVLNDNLYLYNYDYSKVEVNCKKINGDVKLLGEFTIIPHFLKNIVITGEFNCRKNLLETLINCPQNVNSIDCCSNNLISLKGAPSYINGTFICSHNNLKNLNHSPRIINGIFDVSHNEINTLIGSPIQVGIFCCFNNDLNSLIGITQIVSNSISLGDNNIKTLAGLPNIINCDLNIEHEKVISLKNVPQIIKGNFGYSECYLVDDYRPRYDNNGYLINEYNG